MNIEQTLQELDRLFAEHQIQQVEVFLENSIHEALHAKDEGSAVTLMNEIIGYYRDLGMYEKGRPYCGRVIELIEAMDMKDSLPYATTLLNIANFYRASGSLEKSLGYYKSVFDLYEGRVLPEDMLYASLYNNLSLLYQEMENCEGACRSLEKALEIVSGYPDKEIEVAITYTNLANSKLKLNRVEEAIEDLQSAFHIFNKDEEKDYHYSGALSSMAQAQYMLGNLEESAKFYKLALVEIKKHTGESASYQIIRQNLEQVQGKLTQLPAKVKSYEKGMDLCEDFYHEYGVPMIRSLFPQYEGMIAAGLVGEGSECFGFDDEISRDHDFGPGFCLWLTEQTYEEIGEQLQEAYDKLPTTYMGVTRRASAKAPKRVGVFIIGDFYKNLIGLSDIPNTQNQWLFVEDFQLAAATNGKIFRDDLGEFTRIRKGLQQYYPQDVAAQKIAREAALIAQTGQYNYGRMLGRGDKVTAHMALSEFMKHTMQMVYLLNRRYAPFYKWMYRGMEPLPILSKVRKLLALLSELFVGDEQISLLIEKIVMLIIQEMQKQGLTKGEDTYLDHHTDNILKSLTNKDRPILLKEELIEAIVKLEWEAFDKVENEGGRADCQDDWNTFSLMRKSQYMAWTEEMLGSYIHDFHVANENGWNLITEKYGRMMQSTDPKGYHRIQADLPFIPEEKREIIEAIVGIQVRWMEEFAQQFPKVASNARSIHTSEDNLFNTSYETYLRGELGTYSDKTLDLYGRFIADLLDREENLARMIMDNTAKLYGYSSLQEMEERLY